MPYIITGDEAIRGEHVVNLVTSGDDATVPFEVILRPVHFFRSAGESGHGEQGHGAVPQV